MLTEITVKTEKENRQFSSAPAVLEHLHLTPSLLLNSQGGAERQNDISIRGGSFSESGFAVNGLTLKNPQTEHFNAELPLPMALFRAPQTLTGLEQARRSPGNIVGSIDFAFKPMRDGGHLQLGVGTHERNLQSFMYEKTFTKPDDETVYGAGVFGRRDESNGRDYDDNNLELYNFGGHMQYRTGNSQTDFVFARQKKTFGTRGYYGVSPDFRAKEELRDTLALASTRIDFESDATLQINAMWRELDDDYKLWLPDFLYHNEHKSTIKKAGITAHHPLGSGFNLDWIMNGDKEEIDSSSLGEHWREHADISFLPSHTSGHLRLTTGVRLEVFSDDRPAWLPQTGLEFELSDKTWLYASYTKTVKQPSFTELNYESPGSLGNAGLVRQESENSETGLRSRISENLNLRTTIFYRRSDDTVDWLKINASDRWTAANLGTLETAGIEGELGFSSDNNRLFLDLYYAYISKSHAVDPHASRYALDYARHLFQLTAVWRATSTLRLTVNQGFRWQTDNAERDGGDFSVPARIAAQWSPSTIQQLSFNVSIENLWNDQFQMLPGQRACERATLLSVVYGF